MPEDTCKWRANVISMPLRNWTVHDQVSKSLPPVPFLNRWVKLQPQHALSLSSILNVILPFTSGPATRTLPLTSDRNFVRIFWFFINVMCPTVLSLLPLIYCMMRSQRLSVGYRSQDEICDWRLSCRGAAVGTVHWLTDWCSVGVFESRVLRGRKWQQTGENCEMRRFVVLLLIRYCESEMGSACGTYGGEGKRIQDSGGESWRKETSLMM